MKARELLSLWAYRVLWWGVLPVLLIRNLIKSRRLPGYRQRWWQRLGWVPSPSQLSPTHANPLWIHAVSVGESVVAQSLVSEIRARLPELPILVTTMTPTGSQRVVSCIGDQVMHTYAPYDHDLVVDLFLHRVRPRALIMIDTEIWPNWVLACRRKGIPTALVNGRLSQISSLAYAKFGAFSRLVVSRIDVLAMQAEADSARMQRLGAAPKQLTVTGSVKLDIEYDQMAAEKGREYRERFGQQRPVWIAASTHEGEETMLLDAHRAVQQRVPEALLVLVPRHPDRFGQVAQQLQQSDWVWQRHSEDQLIEAETSVVLADVLGEMLALFAASDVAVIGGSFVPVGGHNMLEAMVMDVPVMIGPHVFNFQTLTDQLVAEKAMLQVPDAQALVAPLSEWLMDSTLVEPYKTAAQGFLQKNKGALGQLVSLLQKRGIF